ncbi:MAG: pyridoxal phosphate-dependent aminotransferase [Bacilli bacterium]
MNKQHGANIYDYDNYCDLLDYSSNLNPLGIPEFKNSIDIFDKKYSRYPDALSRKLVQKLSYYENVAKDHIYIGSGANDLIFRMFLAIRPRKTLLIAPSFSEYEKGAKLVDSECIYYYLDVNNHFKLLPDFLNIITNEIDFIVLCNPNNPTGNIIDRELLEAIIKKCNKHQYIMVDECFIDFLNDSDKYSVKKLVNNNSNLIVLKAFTKFYAMAGYRIGYCFVNNSKLISKVIESGNYWPVCSISQEIAFRVLEIEDYVEKSKSLIKNERAFLENELKKLGLTVYDGLANYILFRYDKEFNLKAKLLKHNILIRSCDNYKGLDESFYRIAVKNRSDNQKFISCLKKSI